MLDRYNIKNCQKIKIEQGAFYLGESTKKKSVGYLELKPHSSLTLHNRWGGIENLTQIKESCVMVVFDKPSLTYWHFEGDIRDVIDAIKKGAE